MVKPRRHQIGLSNFRCASFYFPPIESKNEECYRNYSRHVMFFIISALPYLYRYVSCLQHFHSLARKRRVAINQSNCKLVTLRLVLFFIFFKKKIQAVPTWSLFIFVPFIRIFCHSRYGISSSIHGCNGKGATFHKTSYCNLFIFCMCHDPTQCFVSFLNANVVLFVEFYFAAFWVSNP